MTDRLFCQAMLPKVSRTFAVCIRLLPPKLEHSVLVAYLLCRIADTIEDTTTLGGSDKARLLDDFRGCLHGEGEATSLREAFDGATSDEERLAHDADSVLREYRHLPAAHQEAIRPFVQEMCAGMAEFATRERASRSGDVALETVADLERYCYYVAGTVGHLLTDLFRLQGRSLAADQYHELKDLATSFGLGLQLTNIIKDVADDRRRGWSFIPLDLCAAAGLQPDELQVPERRRDAERVMQALIAKARGHLRDALSYCTTLPSAAYRIRIFCLTSLYFAIRTLRLAERDPRLLDPRHKVKITRGDVYRTVATTHVIAPFNPLVRTYFLRLAGTGP